MASSRRFDASTTRRPILSYAWRAVNVQPDDVTPEIIASNMRMHVTELLDDALHNDHWYKPPEMKAAGKKHRECDIPHRLPKKRLKLLHRFAQAELPVHACVHGGIKERSCYTAAKQHCGRYAVVNRDIADCYPN